MKYSLTEHAAARLLERGITLEEVNAAITQSKPYKSKLYGGQLRYYKGGICVIVRKSNNSVITAYRVTYSYSLITMKESIVPY
jgi:hypothetical protein